MSDENAIDRLKGNQLFKEMSESAVEKLCSVGQFITINKDEVIVSEGQTNDNLYLICSGVCEVSLGSAPGQMESMRIATHGPQGFFGEYSFLDRGMASANVRAATDAELYRIPFDRLDKMLEEDLAIRSSLYRNMLDVMVTRLRESVAELSLFGGAAEEGETDQKPPAEPG